jgi:hypothetical protein
MENMHRAIDMLIRMELLMLQKDNQDNPPHVQALNPDTADMSCMSNRSLELPLYKQVYAYKPE